MPKVSSETATTVQDFGVAIDRSAELDGYTVDFVTITETHSLAPMLAGLPDGRCHCPHWGYLLAGRMTVHYADHDEVVEPGDAFYMAPGHVPEAVEGTELVQISPTDEFQATQDAIARAMQAR